MMEEKKEKPMIVVAGGGYGLVGIALAAAAFADHLREKPAINTVLDPPVIDAAERKRQRKAEKRTRDAAKTEKRNV
jgi:FixJ family two-component response regulator